MLTLLRNEVAVSPRYDPDVSPGGIIIPSQAKERCDQGVVKYLGPKTEFLLPGDHVLFSGYDGTLARVDGEEVLIILPETKIVCILNPPSHDIHGLYFKSRLEENEINDQIDEIISITGCTRQEAVQLFSKGYQREVYFKATYEMAIQLMAEAITKSSWNSKYRFTDRLASAPRREEMFANNPWLSR